MRGMKVRAVAFGRARRGGGAITALAAASLLASGCTSASPTAHVSASPGLLHVPVSLPAPESGEITFYLSLPASMAALDKAAASASTPGSPRYRHFSSLGEAARQFGATDTQINTVAAAMSSVGLRFAADPTRLFGRVTGSSQQWKAALRVPLSGRRPRRRARSSPTVSPRMSSSDMTSLAAAAGLLLSFSLGQR
jgi:hypothetical protein